MTAAEADNPATRAEVRQRILEVHRRSIGDPVIRAYLHGYPANAGNNAAMRMALAALGVDVATIPVRTPEEIAEYRSKRNPPRAPAACSGCEELRARVLELEARIRQIDETEHGGVGIPPMLNGVAAPGYNVILTGLTEGDDRTPSRHDPAPALTLDDVLPTRSRPRPPRIVRLLSDDRAVQEQLDETARSG